MGTRRGLCSLLFGLLLLTTVACNSGRAQHEATESQAESAAPEATESPGHGHEETAAQPSEHEAEAETAAETVELGQEGTRFDPAVAADRIPPGAWYCDMGTVHYASMEQGDGSCPVCGMTLVQREAGE